MKGVAFREGVHMYLNEDNTVLTVNQTIVVYIKGKANFSVD